MTKPVEGAIATFTDKSEREHDALIRKLYEDDSADLIYLSPDQEDSRGRIVQEAKRVRTEKEKREGGAFYGNVKKGFSELEEPKEKGVTYSHGHTVNVAPVPVEVPIPNTRTKREDPETELREEFESDELVENSTARPVLADELSKQEEERIGVELKPEAEAQEAGELSEPKPGTPGEPSDDEEAKKRSEAAKKAARTRKRNEAKAEKEAASEGDSKADSRARSNQATQKTANAIKGAKKK